MVKATGTAACSRSGRHRGGRGNHYFRPDPSISTAQSEDTTTSVRGRHRPFFHVLVNGDEDPAPCHPHHEPPRPPRFRDRGVLESLRWAERGASAARSRSTADPQPDYSPVESARSHSRPAGRIRMSWSSWFGRRDEISVPSAGRRAARRAPQAVMNVPPSASDRRHNVRHWAEHDHCFRRDRAFEESAALRTAPYLHSGCGQVFARPRLRCRAGKATYRVDARRFSRSEGIFLACSSERRPARLVGGPPRPAAGVGPRIDASTWPLGGTNLGRTPAVPDRAMPVAARPPSALAPGRARPYRRADNPGPRTADSPRNGMIADVISAQPAGRRDQTSHTRGPRARGGCAQCPRSPTGRLPLLPHCRKIPHGPRQKHAVAEGTPYCA